MKIWNSLENDNGKIALIVSFDYVASDGLPAEADQWKPGCYQMWEGKEYQVVSVVRQGSMPEHNLDRWLVVMKPANEVPDIYGDSDTPMIPVLNGGFVRYIDHRGSDLAIVRAARVSYDADWRTGDNENSDRKLIRYLMKNHHTSPFEACNVIFEVKVPLFIARQWHRHRTWSYNEVSGRYTKLDMGWFLPDPRTIGFQSKDNKQARVIPDTISEGELKKQNHLIKLVDENIANTYKLYEYLLEQGWPRELARIPLPVAAYTRYFADVDLHNLFHFLRLRLHDHAQYEVREYAEAMLALIEPLFPVAVEAFKETLPK